MCSARFFRPVDHRRARKRLALAGALALLLAAYPPAARAAADTVLVVTDDSAPGSYARSSGVAGHAAALLMGIVAEAGVQVATESSVAGRRGSGWKPRDRRPRPDLPGLLDAAAATGLSPRGMLIFAISRRSIPAGGFNRIDLRMAGEIVDADGVPRSPWDRQYEFAVPMTCDDRCVDDVVVHRLGEAIKPLSPTLASAAAALPARPSARPPVPPAHPAALPPALPVGNAPTMLNTGKTP